jgi:hypothetical protein
VHLAEGSYRLLRANDAATACDYCHGISGVANKRVVLDTEGHGLGGQTGTITAPDDTDPGYSVAATDWGCAKCHSVHGSETNTVDLQDVTGTKLLFKDPAGDGSPFDSTNYLSEWCGDCHGANFGIHTQPKTVGGETRYGHDVSGPGQAGATYGDPSSWTVDPADGNNQGPKCKDCHTASGGAGTAKFPHSSGTTTPDMLESGTQSDQLDAVCTACHNTASLP